MENITLAYTVIVAVLLLAAMFRAFLDKHRYGRRVFAVLHVVEVGAISILLFSLIFFGILQIVLRNFFNSGLVWADPLMRHAVLWLGVLGGAMATTRVRHISIDVFSQWLPKRMQPLRDRVIHLATAMTAAAIGLATLRLVLDEKAFAEEAFLGLGVWHLMVILPIGFFMIAYRSFVNMLEAKQPQALEWEDLGDASEGDATVET